METIEPSPVLRQTLYRLTDVCVSGSDGPSLGPITWTLARGQRIGVRCAQAAQWDALLALLTGTRRPTQGTMEELHTVVVQTDQRLRAELDPNATLDAFLHSADAPEQVWIEGRRRATWVLVDALGITPAMTRRAYKLLGPEAQHRAWVLRFVLSQADLVLGREVFRGGDAQIQNALRRRWSDVPGALVACSEDGNLPGPVHAWAHLDAAGGFRLEPVPQPGAEQDAASPQ